MRRIKVTYQLDEIRKEYNEMLFSYMGGAMYGKFHVHTNSHMSDTTFFILPAHRDLIWTIRTINKR